MERQKESNPEILKKSRQKADRKKIKDELKKVGTDEHESAKKALIKQELKSLKNEYEEVLKEKNRIQRENEQFR